MRKSDVTGIFICVSKKLQLILTGIRRIHCFALIHNVSDINLSEFVIFIFIIYFMFIYTNTSGTKNEHYFVHFHSERNVIFCFHSFSFQNESKCNVIYFDYR